MPDRIFRTQTAFQKLAQIAVLVSLATTVPACMHVIAYDTPYFRDGPQQLREPDGDLKSGTHVWITGQKDTYRKVLTLTGVYGYVWNGAIKTQSEWRALQQPDRDAEKIRKEQAKQPAQKKPQDRALPPPETQKQTKPL